MNLPFISICSKPKTTAGQGTILPKVGLAFFLLLSATVLSQKNEVYTRCISGENTEEDSIIHLREQKDAAFVALQKKGITQTLEAGTIAEIPVVVHVLYKTSTQNISNAKIQSQIRILNEDYQKLNANVNQTISQFLPLATDAKIVFKLATVDPQGKNTSGINRKSTTKNGFDYTANEAKKSSLGGIDAWPTDQYLNLWVVNTITYQGQGGTLGYAQFPGGDPATDGVVIVYNAFGDVQPLIAPYDKGRTATHEIGHWLGLYHLWGKNNDGCNAADDDLISDTPMQSEATAGCDKTKNTCGNLNMIQNFMDYTDDACMTLFTKEQVDKIHYTLQTYRNKFLVGDVNTSINSIGEQNNVFPNPFSNEIQWTENANVRLYNLLGELIYVAEKTNKISALETLNNGIYFLHITHNGRTEIKKLLKQ